VYEYKVTTVIDLDDIENAANKWAQDGWRLVGVLHPRHVVLILERENQEL
jgi:hypothetical protein